VLLARWRRCRLLVERSFGPDEDVGDILDVAPSTTPSGPRLEDSKPPGIVADLRWLEPRAASQRGGRREHEAQ